MYAKRFHSKRVGGTIFMMTSNDVRIAIISGFANRNCATIANSRLGEDGWPTRGLAPGLFSVGHRARTTWKRARSLLKGRLDCHPMTVPTWYAVARARDFVLWFTSNYVIGITAVANISRALMACRRTSAVKDAMRGSTSFITHFPKKVYISLSRGARKKDPWQSVYTQWGLGRIPPGSLMDFLLNELLTRCDLSPFFGGGREGRGRRELLTPREESRPSRMRQWHDEGVSLRIEKST